MNKSTNIKLVTTFYLIIICIAKINIIESSQTVMDDQNYVEQNDNEGKQPDFKIQNHNKFRGRMLDHLIGHCAKGECFKRCFVDDTFKTINNIQVVMDPAGTFTSILTAEQKWNDQKTDPDQCYINYQLIIYDALTNAHQPTFPSYIQYDATNGDLKVDVSQVFSVKLILRAQLCYDSTCTDHYADIDSNEFYVQTGCQKIIVTSIKNLNMDHQIKSIRSQPVNIHYFVFRLDLTEIWPSNCIPDEWHIVSEAYNGDGTDIPGTLQYLYNGTSPTLQKYTSSSSSSHNYVYYYIRSHQTDDQFQDYSFFLMLGYTQHEPKVYASSVQLRYEIKCSTIQALQDNVFQQYEISQDTLDVSDTTTQLEFDLLMPTVVKPNAACPEPDSSITVTYCRCSYIQILPRNTNVLPVDSKFNYYANSPYKYQETTIQFRFNCYMSAGGYQQLPHDMTKYFKMTFQCGLSSTTLTPPTISFNCDSSASCSYYIYHLPGQQAIQISNFTNQNSVCPMQTAAIEEHPSYVGQNAQIVQGQSVSASQQSGGIRLTFPSVIQIETIVRFQIRVTSKGGASAVKAFETVRLIDCSYNTLPQINNIYVECTSSCSLFSTQYGSSLFHQYCAVQNYEFVTSSTDITLQSVDTDKFNYQFGSSTAYLIQALVKIRANLQNGSTLDTNQFQIESYNCLRKVYVPPTIAQSDRIFDIIADQTNYEYQILQTFTSSDAYCTSYKKQRIAKALSYTLQDKYLPDGTSQPSILSGLSEVPIRVSVPRNIVIPFYILRFRIQVEYDDNAIASFSDNIFITILNCQTAQSSVPQNIQNDAGQTFQTVVQSNQFDLQIQGKFTNNYMSVCQFTAISIVPWIGGSSQDYTLSNQNTIQLKSTVTSENVLITFPQTLQLLTEFKFRLNGHIQRQNLDIYSSQYHLKIINCDYSEFIADQNAVNITGVMNDGSQYYELVLAWQFQSNNVRCPFNSLDIVPISLANSSVSNYTTLSNEFPLITSTVQDSVITIDVPRKIEMKEKIFTFRVKASSEGGSSSHSNRIDVQVIDCNYQIPVQTNYTLDIKLKNDSITNVNFPIIQGFTPYPGCQINDYRIQRVVDDISKQDVNNFENIITIDSSGILVIKDKQARSKILIYVQSRTSLLEGSYWSESTDPVASLEIEAVFPPALSQSTQSILNSAPLFVSQPKDLQLTLNDENSLVNYQIPDIFDPQNHTTQLTATGLEEWMKLDQNSKTILIENPVAGSYTVTLTLKDELDKTSTSSFNIIIEKPENKTKEEDKNETEQEKSDEKPKENDVSVNFANFFNNQNFEIKEQPKEKKEEIKTIEKMRKPINLNITEINPNGQITIFFSEKLKSITYWNQRNLTIENMNKIKKRILSVNYYCMLDICQNNDDQQSEKDIKNKPELLNWEIIDFLEYKLVLKAKFKNPLYVSSSQKQKDVIGIDVLNSALFIADKDFVTLSQNYTIDNYTLPSQARSEKEFEMLQNVGSSVENSLLLTLIIPFVFMLFMSVSMEKVWSFYLMLQITSNLLNYNSLIIPANAQHVLKIAENVSNFKLLQEPNVKAFIALHIILNDNIRNLLVGSGTLVSNLILLSVLLEYARTLQKNKSK